MRKRKAALENVSLRNMINTEDFASIQNALASLVDVSMVTVDIEGVPIGELSNFTPFCQLVRSSPAGRLGCEECDRVASLRALRLGKPQSYTCHCGLKDCTAPIVADGMHIGGVLGGQVFVREADRAKVSAQKLSKKFDLPLDKLEECISQVKVVSEDYLERCLRMYSFMANYFAETGLKNLIHKRLQRERQRMLQLERIAKEQEIKRMQAQMNPHFLFNALNSIARIALLEGAGQTERLIYDLSKYLRYSIKNSQATPKMSQELENLMHYISIQRTRFGDRISFEVHIDPQLLNWSIPSMTLQPLVENSINHGLESRASGGHIQVEGAPSRGGKEMVITIYDNGEGFPQEIVDLLQNGNWQDESWKAGPAVGLGLLNTHERIKRLYGDEFGVSVESERGKFSRVTIRLPKHLDN